MYTIDELVTNSKSDAQGRLKLVSAFQMMSDCSEMWYEAQPELNRFSHENHRGQYLASRQVEILRVPLYQERLTVSTHVYECSGSIGYRNTIIRDAKGDVCYATWCAGAFVDTLTQRLCPYPPEIVASVQLEPRFDMPYRERRILQPKSEPIRIEQFHVMRDDIDYNVHMNNAQYVRMAIELLPTDFDPRHIRVEYKRAVVKGDSIQVALYQSAPLCNDKYPSEPAGTATYTCILSSNAATCVIVEFAD